MSLVEEKVSAYLKVIEDHVIGAIERPDVQKSCVATLLLIFAAIDGLGKLLHEDKTAKVNERFRFFLEKYMGGDYATKQNDIWAVRNELSHNALNSLSFMSHTYMGENQHLEANPSTGLFFISTNVLIEDFKSALAQVRDRIKKDCSLLDRAADRLEFLEEDPRAYWSSFSTPPGPVKFISMKKTERTSS